MKYLTKFSPFADGFAFPNSGFAVTKTEIDAYYAAFEKAAAASLLIRPPFLDAAFDMFLLTVAPLAPFATEIQRVAREVLLGFTEEGARSYGLCAGMCFAALDNYYSGNLSLRGKTGAPTASDGPEVRAWIGKRQIDALLGGVALTTLAWKANVAKPQAILSQTGEQVRDIVEALSQGRPVPLILIASDPDPTQSHCVVAYGVEVHTQGSRDLVTFTVGDPNDPVRFGPGGFTAESKLQVEIEGRVAKADRAAARRCVACSRRPTRPRRRWSACIRPRSPSPRPPPDGPRWRSRWPTTPGARWVRSYCVPRRWWSSPPRAARWWSARGPGSAFAACG